MRDSFAGVILAIELLFGAIGLVQINDTPIMLRFSDTSRRELTGTWNVSTTYQIFNIDSAGNKTLIDNVQGLGQQVLCYREESKSFDGIGWVSIGTTATTLDDAKNDQMADVVTFEVEGFFETTGRWKISTDSVHKTLRSRLNTSRSVNVTYSYRLRSIQRIGKARACATTTVDE